MARPKLHWAFHVPFSMTVSQCFDNNNESLVMCEWGHLLTHEMLYNAGNSNPEGSNLVCAYFCMHWLKNVTQTTISRLNGENVIFWMRRHHIQRFDKLLLHFQRNKKLKLCFEFLVHIMRSKYYCLMCRAPFLSPHWSQLVPFEYASYVWMH